MKRVKKLMSITLLIITVFLTSCNINGQTISKNTSQIPNGYIPSGEYPGSLEQIRPLAGEIDSSILSNKINYSTVKGVWISYLNLKIEGMTAEQYTEYIENIFSDLSQYGINTVYFQARPYSDALYKSNIFPWSHIITGQQGVDPGYDPLEIAVQKAHEHKLSFHAWINPFRVQTTNGENSTPSKLSENNPALEGQNITLKYNGDIWYNPASEKAQGLIIDGICEIISKYNVDGIQFDDYFYPASDSVIDAGLYEHYKLGGGKLSQSEWRRDNVNRLIKACYDTIKRYDSDILFGISPNANIDKNFNQLYADVQLWISKNGYIDYICPQIYFGFENQTMPFKKTLESWISLTENSKVRLSVGLAGYKTGGHDKYAGSGKEEFIKGGDILTRQAKIVIEDKTLYGISIYDSDFIIGKAEDIRKKERDNLKQYLRQIE